MTGRFRTRWVVVAFLVIGMAVAVALLVRNLEGDGQDVPQEEGTVPQLAA